MTMASCSIHYLFLLSLSLFSVSCFSSAIPNGLRLKSNSFILPIHKDPQTSLFYTSLGIGQNPLHKFDLTIDLGGPSLWYKCDSHYNSSSYSPVPCNSKQCPPPSFCFGCNGPFRPGCSNNTCGHYVINPFSNSIFSGSLGKDVIFIGNTKVSGLRSGCDNDNYENFLEGLPKQSKGILGLARTQLSLPLQISPLYNLPPKFSICLPSNRINGKLFLNSGAPSSVSQFLFTTPLITNPVSTAPIYSEGDSSYEYFIEVLSINVDGKVVNFNTSLLSFDKKGNGGTKISTMQNFTRLHSNIFKPLVRDFVKSASDKKMKKVKSVAPFEACYDEQSIRKTSTGMLDVPIVELIVEGKVGSGAWTIYGSNSMVKVKRNVVCLGFLDGGKTPKDATGSTAIVIGGHQLENNLLEFDLSASLLSFTGSLLIHNTSCSSHTV